MRHHTKYSRPCDLMRGIFALKLNELAKLCSVVLCSCLHASLTVQESSSVYSNEKWLCLAVDSRY